MTMNGLINIILPELHLVGLLYRLMMHGNSNIKNSNIKYILLQNTYREWKKIEFPKEYCV